MRWHDGLLTGVSEIDRQHRLLIDTLCELQSGGQPGARVRPFEDVMRDLLAYAIYHFETEEGLIQRYGYDRERADEARAHLLEHREFSRRVVELRDRVRPDDEATRQALVSLLQRWLSDHLTRTDALLVAFLRPKLQVPA